MSRPWGHCAQPSPLPGTEETTSQDSPARPPETTIRVRPEPACPRPENPPRDVLLADDVIVDEDHPADPRHRDVGGGGATDVAEPENESAGPPEAGQVDLLQRTLPREVGLPVAHRV